MRRAGLWIVAVCVGFVVVLVTRTAVSALVGAPQGGAAVAYVFGLPVVFGFTTAWVVTWLEAISRPARRSHVRGRAH